MGNQFAGQILFGSTRTPESTRVRRVAELVTHIPANRAEDKTTKTDRVHPVKLLSHFEEKGYGILLPHPSPSLERIKNGNIICCKIDRWIGLVLEGTWIEDFKYFYSISIKTCFSFYLDGKKRDKILERRIYIEIIVRWIGLQFGYKFLFLEKQIQILFESTWRNINIGIWYETFLSIQ